MTSFILPRHANAEMLHKMLRCFRVRLENECVAEETSQRERVTYELLESMVETLQVTHGNSSAQQCILYWPLKNKTMYETKRCLYERPGTHNIHLVYVSTLIDKLHPTKNHFNRCQCDGETYHADRIRFDWREFIYPQFVTLLFGQHQLPSACPSPSTSNAHCIINEKFPFTMEIDRSAAFLTNVVDEVFRLPCQELYAKYKNRHLTAFGQENVASLCHFRERRCTEENYKMVFKLPPGAKIRATHIIAGGRLSIKSTVNNDPYVLIASNFYLLPGGGGGGVPHYKIQVFTKHGGHHQALAYHEKGRIKSTQLCENDQWCMIVSSSPLTIEFKEGWQASFLLTSPGYVNVVLRDCHLELWSRNHQEAWPMRYEIASRDLCRSEYDGSATSYYAKLYARYDALFNNAHFSTACMEAPAHGYVLCYDENEVTGCTNKGETICTQNVKYHLLTYNQYGTMMTGEYDNNYTGESTRPSLGDLRHLRVYYRGGSASEPIFWDERRGRGEAMSVVRELVATGIGETTMNALYRKGEASAWCYFYVNRERTYMLFIPIN